MTLRSWLFLGLALTVASVCIRLGIWQLDRLDQRRQHNAAIKAGLARPPLELDGAVAPEPLEPYRRVTATGKFDPDHEIVLTARAWQGQPGVHLVTPLLLPGGERAILVDRGWIPFDQYELPARARYQVRGEVTLTGLTKPTEPSPSSWFLRPKAPASLAQPRLEWRSVDISAIQDQTPYRLLDLYVAQSEPLPGGQPAPRPQPEIDLSEGPHLGYAIQWFSFAAIALIGGGYWLRRQRAARR